MASAVVGTLNAVVTRNIGQSSFCSAAAYNKNFFFFFSFFFGGGVLTEAIEYVEEGDQHHSCDIYGITPFPKIEWTTGEVSAFGDDVGRERNRI